MWKKIRENINMIVLFIFAIAILYGIFIICINIITPKQTFEIVDITKENVDIYIDNEKIVYDYNTFYTIESICQDIIQKLQNKNYNSIYSSMSDNFKKGVTRKQFLDFVPKYLKSNFEFIEGMDSPRQYINTDNLKMLYTVEDKSYIAVVTSLDNITTNIGIKLISSTEYMITYLDI